jgi:hypothetical protein
VVCFRRKALLGLEVLESLKAGLNLDFILNLAYNSPSI